MPTRLLLVSVLLVTMAVLVQGDPALAQTPAVPYPKTIELEVAETESAVSYEYSFSVPVAVRNLAFTPGPLIDTATNSPVLAASVTVTPTQIAELSPGVTYKVALSVNDLPGAGSYTSKISITYDGQAEGTEEAISVALEVQPLIEPLLGPVLLTLMPKEDGTGHVYRGVLRVTSASDSTITGLRLANKTDLVDTEHPERRPILATRITVTPDAEVSLPAREATTFELEAPVPSFDGVYTGTIDVAYALRPKNVDEQFTVPVRLEVVPASFDVEPEDLHLELRPQTAGGSYQDTFTLMLSQGEVRQIKFSPQDLEHTGSAGQLVSGIAGSLVTVTSAAGADPAKLDATTPVQSFTVEVARPSSGNFPAGTYTGPLFMYYSGTGAENQQDNQMDFTVSLTIDAPDFAIVPSEELVLRQGNPGDPYQDTFSIVVSEGELRDIQIKPQGSLKHDGDELPIETASFEPLDTASLVLTPASGSTGFTVKVNPPSNSNFMAGTYTGTLGMTYFGGTRTLDLTLRAEPEATVEWTKSTDADNSITIKGATSGSRASRTYPLTLIETGKLSDARLRLIQAEELLGTTDPSISLPPSVLTGIRALDSPTATIAAGKSQTYTLAFDLSKQDPGAYGGFVRVESDNADTIRLPLNITLRHPFLWKPFLVFIVGAVLAVGMQTYASKYRKRDQLRSAVERWEKQLTDKEEAVPTEFYLFYGEVLRKKLAAANDILEAPDWAVKGNLEKAEELVDTYSVLRNRWLAHDRVFGSQRAYLSELRDVYTSGKYQQHVSNYRYLQTRKQAVDDILANPEGYDTGQKFKDAVTAEWNRFDIFDLAFQLEEWAVGDLLGMLPPNPYTSHPKKPGQFPSNFPSKLKGAFQKRLEEQSQKLRTSLDDTQIKGAGDEFKSIGDEMRTAIETHHKVREEVALLQSQLKHPDVKAELQGDERKLYDGRLEEQKTLLTSADEQADLEGVSKALDQITADLQALYQQWRRFYYDDTGKSAVRTQADKWIKEIVANPPQDVGWTAMLGTLKQMESTAKTLVDGGKNYQLASNLIYFRWRIAWFYREAVTWAKAELDPVTDPKVKGPAEKVLREKIESLLNMAYQKENPQSFDKAFLDQHLEPLYKAVNEACHPALVKGPPAEVPPEPLQYRPLPSLSTSQMRALGPPGPPGAPDPFKRTPVYWQPYTLLTLGGEGLVREVKSLIEWIRALPSEIWKRIKWLWGDPDTWIFLFNATVLILTFIILLAIGWTHWNSDSTFGDSAMDYFTLFFLSFAGLTTSDAVFKSALGAFQSWGGPAPKGQG